jgi:pyruvate-ferredoxin/flavodoxin oxidoreductase
MRSFETIDGNEAVARVAYALSEVIAIYPITPATPMGEWADAWSAAGRKNLWGTVPAVIEMQSEGGAAGVIHGALQTGALATTFTASQGLLLMLPNMHKIAGELTPAVFHIAARSLAAQALSIFGDHSDVMAARSTGWAMLCSASVQEAHDFALIAHAVTLESRLPFLHFFDGFRTSHEISKIAVLPPEVLAALVKDQRIAEHRARALSPDHPVLRGTAQNPDIYFQARETVNPFYAAAPDIVQRVMDNFAALTGRQYRLFDYYGAPDAGRVIVLMGSGCETVHETVDYLNQRGEKTGLLKVRLYRPLDSQRLVQALPSTVKAIAVLDRTKEPGGPGEPLFLDVVHALYEARRTQVAVVGGRYGLSSKEFTPAMIEAVFENLASESPRKDFTIGIQDDVSRQSLDFDADHSIERPETFRALFYGLGSDGTVGANKDSIKIIGENTDHHAQGYFVYDSKKSGSTTVSHLRFGPQPIRSTYLIHRANFIGCHQPLFLGTMNVAERLAPGGTLLLNAPWDPEKVWAHLPAQTQRDLIGKKARLFVIDAAKVARECRMANRINTIMQVCFFSIARVLPPEAAIAAIKNSIRKTYGKKGEEIVAINLAAVDRALVNLQEVTIPAEVGSEAGIREPVGRGAPRFVREVLGPIIAGEGDRIPVSALPADGTYPTGTARWEKRNLATEIPVWDPSVCIQCGKCVFVCPHAVIRSKVYGPALLEGAPATFKSHDARLPEWKGFRYSLQVAPEDCTGCGICVEVCPARNKSEARLKAINLRPQAERVSSEHANWDFFLSLPEADRQRVSTASVRGMQTLEPLFEFSGACAGCGETPYLKLLTQLFGDRLVIANATGCSSIYGGNLPTTPWAQNREARGPAWSNSLFEDNAEFGLGFRVSLDKQREFAAELLEELSSQLGEPLSRQIVNNAQKDEADVFEQRQAVAELQRVLQRIIGEEEARDLRPTKTDEERRFSPSPLQSGGEGWGEEERSKSLRESFPTHDPLSPDPSTLRSAATEGALGRRATEDGLPSRSSRGEGEDAKRLDRLDATPPRQSTDNLIQTARRLLALSDTLVRKSVWIVGGDGWAYDIGYGGLDHVLASGRNVKVLVLDTEVYSNTGGQCSKATPRGAVAKFASGGKAAPKKDLGLMAMTYRNIYVASVAMGAKDEHTLKAFLEAEAYDGPALIIAYSHCIAHGINMTTAMQNQKAAVHSGQWLLYRYHPERARHGLNPLQLDSPTPRLKVEEYFQLENRFKMLTKSQPGQARAFFSQAQRDAESRWQLFKYLAARPPAPAQPTHSPAEPAAPEPNRSTGEPAPKLQP